MPTVTRVSGRGWTPSRLDARRPLGQRPGPVEGMGGPTSVIPADPNHRRTGPDEDSGDGHRRLPGLSARGRPAARRTRGDRRGHRFLPGRLALRRASMPRRAHCTVTSASLTAEDLAGHDAVVHMAELSNDPLGRGGPRA